MRLKSSLFAAVQIGAVICGATWFGAGRAWSAGGPEYTFFPTAGLTYNSDGSVATCDARFMVIAGDKNATLAGQQIHMQIGVLAGSSSFEVGFFDGDCKFADIINGQPQLRGWDTGTGETLYQIFTDADGNGTPDDPNSPKISWCGNGTMAHIDPSNPSSPPAANFGQAMPDNNWASFTVSTAGDPTANSGHLFYVLKISNPTPALSATNCFKVRTTGTLALRKGSNISFMGKFHPMVPKEINSVYPNGTLQPSTYSGNWQFALQLPEDAKYLEVWDGDLDYGSTVNGVQDTDDPNTDHTLQPWFYPYTYTNPQNQSFPIPVAEGKSRSNPLNGEDGLGDPQDDNANTPLYRRSPAIYYSITTPDQQTYTNWNPSGNLEWERFRLSTSLDPGPAAPDVTVLDIPGGIYTVDVKGVDANNLNFFHFDYAVLGVDEPGKPRPPLQSNSLRLGDTVFFDENGDGDQDLGEAGIPGVKVTWSDASGQKAVAFTDTAGEYFFGSEDVPANANTQYTVTVDVQTITPANLPSSYTGGTLSSSTTGAAGASADGSAQTKTTGTTDRLDFDFGYREQVNVPIGDRVWLDLDGDGYQDAGEPGIPGVTVTCSLGSKTTGANGLYSFTDAKPNTSYTVTVDPTTVPWQSIGYPVKPTTATSWTLSSGSAGQDGFDFGFGPNVTNPGTGTIGYWKNHPEAWPVQSITIGGTPYTKAQAIAIMEKVTKKNGDKTVDMFAQLTAAKLNVLLGNASSCISAAIQGADTWMSAHPSGSGVGASSPAWTGAASSWHTDLDRYNNGLLCAPHRG